MAAFLYLYTSISNRVLGMSDKQQHSEEELKNQTDAEVVSDADAVMGDVISEDVSIDELVASLAAAEAKAEDNWNQLLRVKAEADNIRRRAERDVENAHKYALEKFVNELLPVKDSLDLGLAAAAAEGADVVKVSEGIELTQKMMASALGKFGVEEVDPTGQKFNPDLHQAMSMQDVPDAEPNTVINVYQKGFKLNERLIRPAMVVVAGANSGGKPAASTKIDETA